MLVCYAYLFHGLKPLFLVLEYTLRTIATKEKLWIMYSGRGKFMPLPLKSKILETPGSLATDDIKMFLL
jgi:hypothetical protein